MGESVVDREVWSARRTTSAPVDGMVMCVQVRDRGGLAARL